MDRAFFFLFFGRVGVFTWKCDRFLLPWIEPVGVHVSLVISISRENVRFLCILYVELEGARGYRCEGERERVQLEL